MFQRSELFFKAHDDVKLFLQKWSKPNAVGTILFTHGHGEHSDSYHRLISEFQNENWNFIGWDLRGHGRSDGVRGYAKDFKDYVSDFDLFLKTTLQLPDVSNKPTVLLAHSMGALVQTCGLIENNYASQYPQIKAQVLSSPFFGLALQVPAWKDSSANFINNFFPKLTLGNEIKNSQLTRDPLVIQEYELDTYRHHRMSPGVYLGFKLAFPKVLEHASEITLPTFMHISDHDPITSSEAALKIFDAIQSPLKKLKIVEGGRHELYNDIGRGEVIGKVIEFVNQFKDK